MMKPIISAAMIARFLRCSCTVSAFSRDVIVCLSVRGAAPFLLTIYTLTLTVGLCKLQAIAERDLAAFILSKHGIIAG